MPFVFVLPALVLAQPLIAENNSAHAKLRQGILRAMRDNPKCVDKAEFLIDDVAIYYKFGGLKEVARNPFLLPKEFPVAAQFTIEAIRQTASAWGPQSRRTLEEYLRRAEASVADQVSLIQNFKGPQQELFQKLVDHRQAIDKILLEAVGHFGRKECRTVVPFCGTPADAANYRTNCYSEPSGTNAAEQGFTVTIKSNPPKAHISYVSSGRYIAASLTEGLDDTDLWKNILTDQKTMNGEYYFRAFWDNGDKRKPVKTEIDRDAVLTITPDLPPQTQSGK